MYLTTSVNSKVKEKIPKKVKKQKETKTTQNEWINKQRNQC